MFWILFLYLEAGYRCCLSFEVMLLDQYSENLLISIYILSFFFFVICRVQTNRKSLGGKTVPLDQGKLSPSIDLVVKAL